MADTIGGIVAELSIDDKMDAGIARARQAMNALESEHRHLDAALKQGAITAAVHAQRTNELAAAQTRLAAALQQAYTRSATSSSQMAVGMNGLSTGSSKAAMGVLQLSYGLEDLQYGVGAVINNIPPLLMGLGVGAGLTGVIAIATVGLKILTDHWHEFATAIGMGVVESATEEMERLGKATKLTADEQERLNRLKSREATHKQVVESRTKEERETEAAMMGVVAEAGGRETLKGLLAVNSPRFHMDDEDRRQIALAQRTDKNKRTHVLPFLANPDAGHERAVRAEIEARLHAENTANVDRLLDNAIKGTEGPEAAADARRKLALMIRKAPGAFRPGLAEKFERAGPEGRKAHLEELHNLEMEQRKNVAEYDRQVEEEARAVQEQSAGRKAERDYRRTREAPKIAQAVDALQEQFDREAITEKAEGGGGVRADSVEEIQRLMKEAGVELTQEGANEAYTRLLKAHKARVAAFAALHDLTYEQAEERIHADLERIKRLREETEADRPATEARADRARERERKRLKEEDEDEPARVAREEVRRQHERRAQRAADALGDSDPLKKERLEQARRQIDRESQEALDRLPGLDTAAEREYLKLLGRSGGDTEASREALEARIRERLEASGMGILPAMERAREMAAATARGVNEEIATRAMNGPPVRNSAVMDASQLNASVQASVTNENAALKVQERMLDNLARIKAWCDRFNLGQPVKAGGGR